MISGLFSFLGSTVARWHLGEVLAVFKARQEHAQELAMLQAQHQIERDRHLWQQEAIAAHAAAGVRVIEAQAAASSQQAADDMLLQTMATMRQPSGVRWIDGFNAFIRPELAQISIILLVGHAIAPDLVRLEGVVLEVVCSVLGLFVGGRINHTGR